MVLVGSSELNILANLNGAIYSGKCCKLHHCTATMLHPEEAIYTDSWLFVFLCCFHMFSISSFGGVIEAKQALYTDLAFPIYTLDVAGFTVVLAIFDFEDAIYTSQKAYFSIK